ncbi:hypothetical protein ACNR9Q_00320 [Maribacter sp. X9]|uniref:hypothetical protein n=1 Tax=Maribacter sp. X9 TaxID=3402159 RepID=UPI003AF35921
MMQITSRKFRDVKIENFNLTSEFNIAIEQAEKKYRLLINRKYNKHRKKLFSDVVNFIKTDKIGIGDLCYMPSPTADINIFISQKEYTSKDFYTKLEILDSAITPNYLLWFLDQKPVKEYILCYGVGAIFTYIPKEVFYKIEIALPKRNKNPKINEIILHANDSVFRILLDQYYQQYLDNFKKGNFMTSAILAGAIAETFLHNYLLEVGLSEQLLNQKTLGAIIGLAEAYLVDREILDFPLVHFKDVQKLRNSAVHPALAKGKIEREEEFESKDFDCFNNIIKYFGL